jgi:hypothetical protein
MPENKRPTKRIKSFRLSWATFETLARLVAKTGLSEGNIVEDALAEYYRNHPEYWPEGKNVGIPEN